MRRIRLRYLLPAAVLAAFAWVAAPALCSQPYLPGAVDFEQRLGAVEPAADLPTARLLASAKRLGKGPVSYRSAADRGARSLRPRRARGRAATARVPRPRRRRRVERVGRGRGRQPGLLRRRRRGPGPRPRLAAHRRPCTTSTSRARRAPPAACSTAPARRSTPPSSAPPRSSSRRRPTRRRPEPVDRDPGRVGRQPDPRRLSAPRAPLPTGTVKAGVIHHTVSANDYTRRRRRGSCSAICRYHRNANGWNDIGYQALVDRFGNVYQGRAGGIRKAVIGAQAQGFNAQTTAIASIGTHTKEAPTQAATKAIVNYLAWKLTVHRLHRQRQDDADLRRRRPEPLPRRAPGAPQPGVRPRDRRPHRLPGRRARRDDRRRSAAGSRRGSMRFGGVTEPPGGGVTPK